MAYINPHEPIGTIRDIWWNQFEIGKPIELELIDYFQGKGYKKGRGIYLIYYAIAVKDYPEAGVIEGDELIVFFSYKSYELALRKMPTELKIPCTKDKANGKNLYMKFVRDSRERCTILHQEPREPTPEHLINAKKHYGMIKAENEQNERKNTKTTA